MSIDNIDLSVLRGKIEIENVIVENPPGYTHKNLLEMSNGRVIASIGSLLCDTVHIKELKLDDINLVIEQKTLTNNLQDVINSVVAANKQRAESEGKELRIDELEITNIKVKAKLLPIPGKADTINLNLSPIRMTNLGTDSKLSTAVLITKIMLAIANGVAEQGAGVLPKDIVNTMNSALDEAIGLGKAAAEEGEKSYRYGHRTHRGLQGSSKTQKRQMSYCF